MKTRSRPSPGFTLVELAVVLAIVAVLTAMAFAAFNSQRPRSELSGASLDLRAMLHAARLEAVAKGHDVAVLVYPDYPVPGQGTGRIVVYSDEVGDFFSDGGAVNFDGFDLEKPATAGDSEIVTTFDVPRGYRFGPEKGQGTGKALPAPYRSLPLDADCTFCLGAGKWGRKGALVFDYAGRARFYADNKAPLAIAAGGSLSLQSVAAPGEVRTLAVVARTGALRSIQFLSP